MKKRTFLFTLLVMIGLVSLVVAQNGANLTYGSAVIGSVGADNAPVQFTFDGTAGDLVMIRVSGAAVGMDPNLILLSPTGATLATNDNLLFDFSRNAALTHRLPVSGTYTIVVGGTAGDFLLTLDANPAPQTTVIELDTPVTVTLPLANQAQVYAFNTDPLNATTLVIDANPLDVDAYIEVLDANGQRVAALRGDLDNACLSFSPGDELNEVRFAAAPEVAGSVTLTLGRGPCVLGEAPQQVITPPPQTFQVTPINGACTIGSRNNFNVRIGPGLQFPILMVWAARQPLQVVGQSQDGQWYAVQVMGVSGWVSAAVVVRGACDQLPVVTPPPAPAASATVGFPAVTITPSLTTTVQATAGSPEVTATVEPTVEVPPTTTAPTTVPTTAPTVAPTTTFIPTIEVTDVITPEVTPPPA